MSETAALALGRRGETLAARYLEDAGLAVLSRNWRCPEGELDLIATDGHTLIICEVKTRTSTHFGTPGEAVTDPKAARIRRLARRYQHTHRIAPCPLRFDILSVLWPPNHTPHIRHLKAAF